MGLWSIFWPGFRPLGMWCSVLQVQIKTSPLLWYFIGPTLGDFDWCLVTYILHVTVAISVMEQWGVSMMSAITFNTHGIHTFLVNTIILCLFTHLLSIISGKYVTYQCSSVKTSTQSMRILTAR